MKDVTGTDLNSSASAPSWAADIEVSASLAAALVQEQFPHLRNLPIQRFGEGWDNVVFSAGQEWLIRLPRRRRAVSGVEREIRCLPLIAPSLPVAIPSPTLVGSPSAPYPWPFFGYRRLPGMEACDLRMLPQQRLHLARPLAHALRLLHRSTGLADVRDSLPHDLRRIESDYRSMWGQARLRELHDRGEELPYEQLSGFLSSVRAISRCSSALVHGDLHFRHILVSVDGELRGIIDWGKLHRGDAALDLQIYWSFIPPEGRPTFLEEYGDVETDQLSLARACAVWLNAVILQHATDQGLHTVAEEARTALWIAATD